MSVNQNTAAVIRRWYTALCFPGEYDRAFEQALESIAVSDSVSIDTYDLACQDGRQNLLSFLYMCDALEEKYRQLGIPREILMDTLQDIVRWTQNWSIVKGELCLFELEWLARIMSAKLFKVGRLQFYLAPARMAVPQYGIQAGENVVELHIPRGEKLSPEAVDASLIQGKAFVATYFPDYSYEYLTCLSWLLDDKLKELLPESSNIIQFGNRFEKIEQEDSNALLQFLFRWDAYEGNLGQLVCNTDLQCKVKKAVLAGEIFHEVLGVIRK